MIRSAIVSAALVLAASFAACAPAVPPQAAAAPRAANDAACHRPAASCAGPPSTYATDVRPVLARHCFKCHAGDGVAADEHDFSRLETLRAQRVALASEIGACAMPPSSEPPLRDSEAQILLRWAVCEGARE